MTPDEAQRAIRDAEALRSNLPADCWRALEAIAGMREEWGVHVTGYPKNIADWAELCDSPEDHITWLPDEEAAEDFATERGDEGFNARIVRRYVTNEEEA